MKINKKAMMSIAIVVLSVSTLVLVISALFIFNAKQSMIHDEVAVASSLEDIYIKEATMKFYLDKACSKVQSTVGSAEDFMTEFKKYKTSEGSYIYPDLAQIENQINEKNIKYDVQAGILNIKFDIELAKGYNFENKFNSALISAKYDYTYSCSRKIEG